MRTTKTKDSEMVDVEVELMLDDKKRLQKMAEMEGLSLSDLASRILEG